MDTNTKSKILGLMEESERKAWDSLGRYKFFMFGYHASAWVKYNQLLDEPLPNPFADIVNHSKNVMKGK